MKAVQLSLTPDRGLDPAELAQLPILERAQLYTDLGLDAWQREAAEQATRAVIAETYGRAA